MCSAHLQPTKEVYKPDNQLQLAEKDLQEEIAKMLTANNPAAPKNTARFNMKERVYKLEPMVEQLLVHYATDGWLMHKASEDARKQQEVEKQMEEAAAKFQNEVTEGGHSMLSHTCSHTDICDNCRHYIMLASMANCLQAISCSMLVDHSNKAEHEHMPKQQYM